MAGFETKDFSPGNFLFMLCGVRLENISAAGVDFEYPEVLNSSRSGMGRTGIKCNKKAKPVRATINMMPGAPEIESIRALDDANIFEGPSYYESIGTGEREVYFNPTLERIAFGTRGVDDSEQIGDTVITVSFLDSGV